MTRAAPLKAPPARRPRRALQPPQDAASSAEKPEPLSSRRAADHPSTAAGSPRTAARSKPVRPSTNPALRPAREAVATYVYCAVQTPSGPPPGPPRARRPPRLTAAAAPSAHPAVQQPSLAGSPAGLAGAGPPRALALGGGLWLVVASVPRALYSEERIERGLADLAWVSARGMEHESVVEHLLASGTVLPMKLFTLYASDERAVADLAARRPALDRTVARVAGCLEWGVRVLLRSARAGGGPGPAAEAGEIAAGEEVDGAAGTSFLLRKKQRQESARHRLADAQEEAHRLFEQLAPHAREAELREAPRAAVGARLLLDAALLVPSGERGTFEESVSQGAARLASSCEVILTGPWPPYHFVGDEG